MATTSMVFENHPRPETDDLLFSFSLLSYVHVFKDQDFQGKTKTKNGDTNIKSKKLSKTI